MDLTRLYSILTKPFSGPRFEREVAGTRNILILTDADRATFRLYFDIPLRGSLNTEYGYGMVTHESFAQQLRRFGWRRIERWIFEEFEPTMVVFSRFGLSDGQLVAAAAQAREIPVIYHLDDDLLNIPKELGVEIQLRQSDPAVSEARRAMIGSADYILASTTSLARELAKEFPEAVIAIGPRAPYLPQSAPIQRARRRTFTIGYMGSRGHQRDLELVVPALVQILGEFPQVRFETFGSLQMPYSIVATFPERVRAYEAVGDYDEFRKILADVSWDLGIAPLVADVFNECKTPIKFLEYTASGIPVLASDSAVYRLGSAGEIMTLVDNSSWYAALKHGIRAHEELRNKVKRAEEWCSKHHSLEQTREDLLKLLSFSR